MRERLDRFTMVTAVVLAVMFCPKAWRNRLISGRASKPGSSGRPAARIRAGILPGRKRFGE